MNEEIVNVATGQLTQHYSLPAQIEVHNPKVKAFLVRPQ